MTVESEVDMPLFSSQSTLAWLALTALVMLKTVVPMEVEDCPSLLAIMAPGTTTLPGPSPVQIPSPSLIVPLCTVVPLLGLPVSSTPPTKPDCADVQYVTIYPFKLRSVLLPPTVKQVPGALTLAAN